jgi:acetyl-CoA carboxylase biotin carboxyl carrier protein
MDTDVTRPEDQARSLARILREEGLAEMEVEMGDQRFRLRRRREPDLLPAPRLTGDDVEQALEALEGLAITSTRVGVVHLRDPQFGTTPAPVGATVEEGQVLAWIQTMGVHQEVRAPRAGRVLEALVAEGDPVEYGQVLLVLQGGN